MLLPRASIEKRLGRIRDYMTLLLCAGLCVVALPSILSDPFASKSYHAASICVLIALALAAGGALLGFLFAIPQVPRSGVSESDVAVTGGGVAKGATDKSASFSTHYGSLQQIADWLLKLLLGAGLTQIGPIFGKTLLLARAISGTMIGSAHGQSAIYGLGVIGYFLSSGFMSGFLLNRLLLEQLLLSEDVSLNDIRERARQEGGRKAASQINTNKIRMAEAETFEAFQVDAGSPGASLVPQGDPSDPQKHRFGGESAKDGRTLTATVTPLGDSTELFSIVVKVTSDSALNPLVRPVRFYLHPSFLSETVVVKPNAGVAQLELVGWGAFTVGAMVDGGQILLELDLSELPTAPEKFRDR